MSTTVSAGSTAPDRAYRWLKERIEAVPRQEELFLTETEIAAASGTSRTPVREALLRLEAEGFVRRIPHKGAYIPSMSDAEVLKLMQARQVIEEWAVREIASNLIPVMDGLDALVARQREAQEDPVGFISIDVEFHQALISAAGNPLFHGFYASLRGRQMRAGVRAVSLDQTRSGIVLTEHHNIVTALRTGDPDTAARAVRAHIQTTVEAMTR
jgi:DNA-binding GntR family transcriptional regulator